MLWADTETFGTIDLTKVGTYRYAYHPDTQVLLLPYALDEDVPRCIDVDGRPLEQAIKEDDIELWERIEAVRNGAERIVFHNSNFDRHVWAGQGIRLDTKSIDDTMVIAYSLGMPGKLERLGEALGLPMDQRKLAAGKRYINRFSKPAPKNHKADRYDRNSHPDEWEAFIEYARYDITAMRACYKRMPRWNMNHLEHLIWELDQRINDRGVRVDFNLVRAAVAIADGEQERITNEIQYTTWGQVDKHTKSAAILEFCKDRGVRLPNLQKETVAAALSHRKMPDEVRRLLELRLAANKATVSKYTAIGARTSEDGALRGGFQYAGAQRTMRWAGRGVQLHNLARPDWWLDQELAVKAVLDGYVEQVYPDALDIVKGVIRGSFIPRKGCKFVVSDLSNIEGRKTAWICGETWKIQAFADFDAGIGPDIYKKTYSESFGVRVEDVTKDMRQVGKVQELAGGYQGWVGAWETFSKAYGMKMLPEEEVCEIMGNWRNAHPMIRAMWGQLERAWAKAILNPDNAWTIGPWLSIRYYPKIDMLFIRLPSGRFIPYAEPRFDMSGDKPEDLRFKGLNDKGMWTWVDTYGGKLLENVVQASSRDILAQAMLRIDPMYPIVLHVHDEVVCEVPEAETERALGFINHELGQTPTWAPGLPLAAAGFIADRYRKE